MSSQSTRPRRAVDQLVENVLGRSRRLLDTMYPDDREEAVGLHEDIKAAMESGDDEAWRRTNAPCARRVFGSARLLAMRRGSGMADGACGKRVAIAAGRKAGA